MIARLAFAIIAFALCTTGVFADPYRDDANKLGKIINSQYAYLDRLPDGEFKLTKKLQDEADAVSDENSLLRFMERALLLLIDHHAITGSSFKDSWSVIPSYSDLWIERQSGAYVVTSVKAQSPAWTRGIRPGDYLVSVGDVKIANAVSNFWNDLGVTEIDDGHAGFAATILAAGRRDRERELINKDINHKKRKFRLPSLYDAEPQKELLTISRSERSYRVNINNSLGNNDLIAAFDDAMAKAPKNQPIIIDLTDTPSGGNTSIARAIMGWFAIEPRSYQVHTSPAEFRQTGIARQWVEQVLPRGDGKFHAGPVTILVGRWTGSMGEGIAIGMEANGARVVGERMAGLLGAVEDLQLPHSKLSFKLPTERLYAVDGTARENFVPEGLMQLH